jgi:glycosyltransferase involved in cell wall biosynthesis
MKFTIITPSYNQARFLSQTIESVINQEGDFEIEYIVMDGGSTDNTVQILKNYKKKLKNDKNIKFYWQSKKDKGQADAINQGLKSATGDIVAYINSDDYYLPGAFEKVRKYFSDHPDKKWAVGNCDVTQNNLKWTFWLKHLWPIQYFKDALYVFNTVNQPAVFMKKQLIDIVGYFDTGYKFAFDYDYWLRCINKSLPGRIYSNLACFRIHENSKGNIGFAEQFREDAEVLGRYKFNPAIRLVHRLGHMTVNSVYKYLK